MKPTKFSLPLEQRAKDEEEQLLTHWNHGPFNFLLQRTFNAYLKDKTKKRREEVEATINKHLPPVTDEMLLSLYQHACRRFQDLCKSRFGNNSGFLKTSSERKFMDTLESILKENPELKGIEVYPSYCYCKNLSPMMKMVVGNHVPDFVIFGIKNVKASAVAIEIDGDSHIDKYQKDLLRDQHLQELKTFTFSIQNSQVQDRSYILGWLRKMYRKPSGALNNQIQYAKRMIWAKTIACNMTLAEIDNYIELHFGISTHLELEASKLAKLGCCPRKIKVELT